MVGAAFSFKMLLRMSRSAFLLTMALASALWAHAARAQMSASDLVTRMDRLEGAIRELTGQIEQLQYRNQQLEQQVQRLQQQAGTAAPAPQLSAPPRTAPMAPPPAAVASPPAPVAPIEPPPSSGRRSDAFDPNANPSAPGAPRPLGTSTATTEPPPIYDRPPAPVASAGPAIPGAPLDLSTPGSSPGSSPGAGRQPSTGELPAPPPRNLASTGPVPVTLPPGATPKDEYDLGYGYIQHKDFALAEDTFRSFLRKYPTDRLSADAQYWLGEALYQDQHYRDAAEAFLAVSTKYENTAKAPDALLRLGQSLAALGEKEAACASLGEVLRKYPRASLSVKQNVDREQKRDHC
jgi:tol-pal system protein YbgF